MTTQKPCAPCGVSKHPDVFCFNFFGVRNFAQAGFRLTVLAADPRTVWYTVSVPLSSPGLFLSGISLRGAVFPTSCESEA